MNTKKKKQRSVWHWLGLIYLHKKQPVNHPQMGNFKWKSNQLVAPNLSLAKCRLHSWDSLISARTNHTRTSSIESNKTNLYS